MNTHKPHLWLEPIRALRSQTISLMTCRTYTVKPHIENQNPNNQNPQILKLALKYEKSTTKKRKKKIEKSRFFKAKKRERDTYMRCRRMRMRFGRFVRDGVEDDSGEIRHKVSCFVPQ